VVSYFEANQQENATPQAANPHRRHLMRLHKGDLVVLAVENDKRKLMRVHKFSEGMIALICPNEANVDARTREKSLKFLFKAPGALGKANASVASVDILGYANMKR
jgi:hypothetical protein